MEVTLFGKHLGNHGPTRVTRGLAKGLAELGHDVNVLAYGDRTDSPHPRVTLDLLNEMPDSVSGWWKLYRTVQERGPSQTSDVFHSLERYPFTSDVRTIQWTSDMFVMWRRTGKRPPIRPMAGEIAINWMSRKGALNAGVTVAQSPETVRQMRSLWRIDADRTIPLGIEEDFLKSPLRGREPPRVLIVGRIERRKGQHRILEHLDPDDDRFDLRLVGGISNEGYAERALDSWAHHHLGYLDDSDLEEEYELADIVVVPSYLENFSMVGLEAMAKGCALIITDGCGLAQFDWATDEAGIFVARDGSHAAELLSEVSSSDRLERYQQSAYQQAKSLTWKQISEQYVDVYETGRNKSMSKSSAPS